MSTGKKILIALIVIFILIQFIRPTRNSSTAAQPNDIFAHHAASDSVKLIVKRACYNCHSNYTNYPWYINVQPVGIWLQDHIDEGKHKLNFSTFAEYPGKKAAHKLEEFAEEVKKGDMPLGSYTLIHKEARLSDRERVLIVAWADSVGRAIKQ